MTDRVLVTGVSGFLAGHVVAELLGHGYAVRGTVRPPADPEATAHLPGIEVVEADLTADAGWADAVDGCRYVVHVASPFPSTVPDHEDELIRPAVEGTLRVLRAAAAGGVDRVVLTSSVAAVRFGHNGIATEADWSDTAACDAYEKSKTLAERAAWDFAAAEPGLQLAVINPGMILGPVQRAVSGTSVEAVRALLAKEMPGVPNIGFATVDVRDVAAAHRLAMERPNAAGNRYICAGRQVSLPEFAEILATRYDVPTRTVPDWVLRLLGRFNPSARTAARYLGRREEVSAAKARTELGWTVRPVEDTILETAASLIRLGVVTGVATRRSPAASSRA